MSDGGHTRTLAELRHGDSGSFGGKSSTLGELIAGGIPVPPGFAVSTSAFRAFVEEAGLAGMIAAEMSRMSPGDVESIGAASHAISQAMRFAPVPDAVRDEVARRYAELGEPPVAVRSSALGEDSQDATFAGQQETYLWVRGADHVCDAVRDCWVSLYSPPAIAYRARLGDGEEPAMGVAVQLMVDAEVSGVLFTCNPVSGDPSMVAVNASWGLGLAVVGGEVTPDDFLVSKVTREVVREHVHAKDDRVRAGRGRTRRGPGRGAGGAARGSRASTRPSSTRSWRSPAASSATSARTRTSSGRSRAAASCRRASSSSSRGRSPRCSGPAGRRPPLGDGARDERVRRGRRRM